MIYQVFANQPLMSPIHPLLTSDYISELDLVSYNSYGIHVTRWIPSKHSVCTTRYVYGSWHICKTQEVRAEGVTTFVYKFLPLPLN